MTEIPLKFKAAAERKSAKRSQKKRKIAESAIEALMELGYANTSLRDIAAQSDLSLGMLHYYFEDRSELIIYCVEIYKQQFVADMIEALDKASGRGQVIDAFSEALVAAINDDKMAHRLWYDIRTQAMFDATFRPVVDQIETMLIDIVRTAFVKAGHQAEAGLEVRYAMLDGVFRYYMQHQIADAPLSRKDLKAVFRGLLEQFL